MNQENQLFTLHRCFIWMDRMRLHFDNTLKNKEYFEQEERFKIEIFLSMSYWYGGLYVLIEGWKNLKLNDKKIDDLLKSPNVNLLKRYRNGAFHFQKKYYNK